MLNFDANATYGTLLEVHDFVREICPSLLNPSSIHRGGQGAKGALEDARAKILEAIGAGADWRAIFTSGATESNNLAIWSAAYRSSFKGHIVTTTIEHPSVLEAVTRVEALGCRVTVTDPSQVVDAIRDDTCLVSVMLANNETGEILPVNEIGEAVRSKAPYVLFHSDCVQALGKLPLNIEDLNVHMISLSAHKIGGFPGCGCLVVKKDISIAPLLVGGPQELKLRAGTENVPGIVSFGIAAEIAKNSLNKRTEKMMEAKRVFVSTVNSKYPSVVWPFKDLHTLPNTVSARFPGILADDLIVAADIQGLCISSGAACSSGKPEPSHVLLAKGFSKEEAKECIRVSFRGDVTAKEALKAAQIIVDCVERMQQ